MQWTMFLYVWSYWVGLTIARGEDGGTGLQEYHWRSLISSFNHKSILMKDHFMVTAQKIWNTDFYFSVQQAPLTTCLYTYSNASNLPVSLIPAYLLINFCSSQVLRSGTVHHDGVDCSARWRLCVLFKRLLVRAFSHYMIETVGSLAHTKAPLWIQLRVYMWILARDWSQKGSAAMHLG